MNDLTSIFVVLFYYTVVIEALRQATRTSLVDSIIIISLLVFVFVTAVPGRP
jgi:hypothetical protein